MAIFLPRWEKHKNKLPDNPEINWSHWRSQGLEHFSTIHGDAVSMSMPITALTPETIDANDYPVRKYNASNEYDEYVLDDSAVMSSNGLTIAGRLITTSATSCRVVSKAAADTPTDPFRVSWQTSLPHSGVTGFYFIRAGGNYKAWETPSSLPFEQNTDEFFAITSPDDQTDTQPTFFVGEDSALAVSSYGSAAVTVTGSGAPLRIGNWDTGSDIRIGWLGVWSHDLDADMLLEIKQAPFEGLKARSKLFAVPSAATDTTAPILTSPTGTKTGSTTASGTVSTDEANGALYFLASNNATETAATIKTGSSQAVTATGSQAVSFTGLTASTTYYAHYVQDDAASNESNVQTSASFTTDAAGVSLVVAGSLHSVSVGSVSLIQQNTLAVNATSHEQAVDNIELTQSTAIEIQGSSHAQSSDNVGIVQQNTLATQSADHAQASSNINLTQSNTLGIQSALHPQSVDNVVLSLADVLIVNNPLQAVAADNIDLTQAHVLVVQGAGSSQSIDNIELSQQNTITVDSAAHSQAVDNIALSQSTMLIVDGPGHAVLVDNLDLIQSNILAVTGALQATTSDNIDLIQSGSLIVSDALHTFISDNITLIDDDAVIITPAGRLFVVSAEERVFVVAAETRTFIVN